jgi:hypothetical protein
MVRQWVPGYRPTTEPDKLTDLPSSRPPGLSIQQGLTGSPGKTDAEFRKDVPSWTAQLSSSS